MLQVMRKGQDWDRNKNGDGFTECGKKELLYKRMRNFETVNAYIFRINNLKWKLYFLWNFQTSSSENLKLLFDDLM